MVKKSIAAALLVAMVAGAEMALAPVFLMHASHVHPAREVTEHMTAHHHVMPAGHRCCPGLGEIGETATRGSLLPVCRARNNIAAASCRDRKTRRHP